jgi:hypothetical protein
MKKTLFLILLLPFIAPAQTENPLPGQIGETNYFEFFSNYYLNLHHWLYSKGLQYNKTLSKDFDSIFKEIKIAPDESTKQNVMLAIKYYADSIVNRNLLFDPGLTDLKYSLEKIADLNSEELKSFSPYIINALQSADSFFRDNHWTEINAKNMTFMKANIELVKEIENDVVGDCAKYYHYKYDGKKFRVDLVDYATFFGAYTTTDPYINAVISSTDKRHEGTQGVEVIFHEVSHGMIDSVYALQEKICNGVKTPVDHNIWHSILFYSTGTFVKNALAMHGKEHEIYLYKNNLAGINPQFKKVIDSVTKYWKLYLDGKISMEKSIRLIVTATK